MQKGSKKAAFAVAKNGLSCLQGKCLNGAFADACTALNTCGCVNDSDPVINGDCADRTSSFAGAAAYTGFAYVNSHNSLASFN